MAKTENNKNKNTKNKASAEKTKSAERQSVREDAARKPYNENAFWNIAAPYILAFLGVFLIVVFLFRSRMNVVGALVTVLYGLFSHATWLIPAAMFLIAARWKKDAPSRLVHFRVLCAALCMLFLASFLHLVRIPAEELTFSVKALYNDGCALLGGGVFGGLLCAVLHKLTGSIGTGIITIFCTLLFAYLMIGVTLKDIFYLIRNKAREVRYDVDEARRKAHEESERLRARSEELAELGKEKEKEKKKNEGVHELAIEDPEEDARDLVVENGKDAADEDKPAEEKKKEKDLLSDFFAEETEPISVVADDEVEPEKSGLEDGNITPDAAVFDAIHGPSAAGDAIDDIFTPDAVIAGGGTRITSKELAEGATAGQPTGSTEPDVGFTKEPVDAVQLPLEVVYEFPPVDLLPGNPNPSVFKVTDDLTETSKNLVNTLASFGVRTKIMNISCGPTVTRYELKPEVGVKVRSIQNLADDIALHLRASSVRIEAPIPGKDAVGIEIPNTSVSTVYIRELIDREEFRNLKSKLSVALGMDVSGTPVYMDIAKMPHLLIAGATGMGKSVCINSFIISILYKARPDEVKLILIDPKKVEFAMYDRIPHLLVPVVTDPKKAAGTLAWAVNEMEYRFNLIEAAKCRDIKSYNAVCEKDDRFKKMSQIVIIIDELADLMMTARDEVETSICRLAQKARAAGMHLIIGTQRPSVDIITGVIKANIPSRIAFTVASQVDSRTIIDIAGAENLVGKGDMLYAPVGCMKPTRVQGSFVGSDAVIEEITDFLRSSGIVSYDAEIQSAIDKEAARCAEKKKGRGATLADGDETYVGSTEGFARDEMMLPALELGVEVGQISTSLIQRKLSLGYARAARIVDDLSEMGYVGPFEGSKPRKVLITREELLELKMKSRSPEA